MSRYEFPHCSHPEGKKCRSNVYDNRCCCLTSTRFDYKLCPFFKTHKKFNEELKKYEGRIIIRNDD